MVTPEVEKRSTGCAISAVRTVATAKPEAIAATPSAITKPVARRRASTAATMQIAASATAAHHKGSCPAVK